MPLPDVTPDQILNAMQHVPTERWGEALRAIENLQAVPETMTPSPTPIKTGSDLDGSALISMWADRTDISNNHEFARDLRRQAERRE